MGENERCEYCSHFKRFYVPPLAIYKDMPKDGFCCDVFGYDGQVMYLGNEAQNAKNRTCEMFSWKGITE